MYGGKVMKAKFLHPVVNSPLFRGMLIAFFLCGAVKMFGATYTAPSCGGVNYSLTSSSLYDAAAYVLTIMQYVVYICYAIASLLSMYSATVIYIKLNTGEEGLFKPILVLFGAIMFLIASTIIMPGFFGFKHVAAHGSYAHGGFFSFFTHSITGTGG